ncbi:MAG: hypothetical protein H0X03_03815, partial [Nitrosopumilus sp.]|nr:hypothetical protein [Nitrosopumilus sp.]
FIEIDKYVKKKKGQFKKFSKHENDIPFLSEIQDYNPFKTNIKYHDVLKILLRRPSINVTEIENELIKYDKKYNVSKIIKTKKDDLNYKK